MSGDGFSFDERAARPRLRREAVVEPAPESGAAAPEAPAPRVAQAQAQVLKDLRRRGKL